VLLASLALLAVNLVLAVKLVNRCATVALCTSFTVLAGITAFAAFATGTRLSGARGSATLVKLVKLFKLAVKLVKGPRGSATGFSHVHTLTHSLTKSTRPLSRRNGHSESGDRSHEALLDLTTGITTGMKRLY
jgi:hypothetical protein